MIAKRWGMLFFVRGGSIYSGQTSPFQGAGQWGYYWSSRADSNTDQAYVLYFDTGSVKSSRNNGRYSGFSLRCLIPTT